MYLAREVKPIGGGFVEGLELWDYRDSQTDKDLNIAYRSQIWRTSFSCSDRTAMAFGMTFYSDSMGRGKVLHEVVRTPGSIEYKQPASGTPMAYMLEMVCSWVK